jgi:hypothetical protein
MLNRLAFYVVLDEVKASHIWFRCGRGVNLPVLGKRRELFV